MTSQVSSNFLNILSAIFSIFDSILAIFATGFPIFGFFPVILGKLNFGQIVFGWLLVFCEIILSCDTYPCLLTYHALIVFKVFKQNRKKYKTNIIFLFES